MEIFGKNIKNAWQVAAGDSNRNFVRLCLDWDIILNGPGTEGRWPDCVDKLRQGWSSKKIMDLRRFCENVEDGDLVVLRLGTKDVYGVGLVVGDYIWNDEFGDVDGWDLQHIRRVRWLWKYDEDKVQPRPKQFKTYEMKFGDTTQLMTSPEVLNWISSLPVNDQMLNRPLKELPESKFISEIDLVQPISEFLFDKGMASNSIRNLQEEIGELIRIAKWYWRAGTNSSEFETISYLVVPLLRALGWTPQKMAIEWHNVDIALFSNLPREDKNLNTVVEVKRKDSSCLTAFSQAKDYAERYRNSECRRLIVTDGIRYGIYLADNDGRFKDYPPDAYLNLVRLRDAYSIYECNGAKETLFYMSPDWKP